MSSPKLTPTTNDKFKEAEANKPLMQKHIVAPHEPLRTGEIHPAFVAAHTATAGGAALQHPTATGEAPLKVALIGTAPSSRHLAPYGDTSWKIWACSAGNQGQIPRVDAWFEIHTSLLWPENEHFGRPYIEWLKQQKFPIYMQDQSLVPNAIPFPRKELIEEFGPYFFTSSFAWMLAMAIKQGAKEIAMYGIDMASRDEYILQRPGAYYFFMEAKRRGIIVSAPHESDIMQPPGLYGFSESTPFGRKLAAREKELKDRIAGMKQQRDNLATGITYLEGAVEDIDYMRNIWSGVDKLNL